MEVEMKKTDLPKGIRFSKGSYEARKTINGVSICLHNKNLDELIVQFNESVEMAKNNIDYKVKNITLNEWYEEWFETTKKHSVKETSVPVMKRTYYRTFGFYIGDRKISSLMPADVQRAINAMDENGVAISSILDSKGQLH
jgi:hypothetical protein